MSILEEISEWCLEAGEEDSARYFYNIKEVDSLESGARCYVIGRKGTGKTAICKYFETSIAFDRFCVKLSFKEFPFNLLYSLDDNQFTTPSQYISLWKYFIYSSLLSMMSKNMAIDPIVREKIDRIFPSDEFKFIDTRMRRWTSREFGASLASVLSVSKKGDVDNVKLQDIWPDLIPAMESIIINHLDSSKYFIVFDELDEDYRNYWDDENRNRYLPLVTSLFKAVSNVRRTILQSGKHVYPIVFLRDDIYELLDDPDKNKWEDRKVHLSWKLDQIRRMIAFRIERSENPSASNFDLDSAWSKVFQHEAIGVGAQNKNIMSSFEYISWLTHGRPRDYVRYLRECARASIAQGHRRVTADTIKAIDSEFSEHLRQELVNEISGIVPDIKQVFHELSQTRNQRYSNTGFIAELDNILESSQVSETTRRLGTTKLAQILYHFSVVGNAERDNRPTYKYLKPSSGFNFRAPVVVHRGLLRSFGLT